MMLFDLARKNLQRNFSSYFLYIASMVFSIVIYFTFVTLKYNDDIEKMTGTSQKISSIMSGSAVVLLFFIVVFIAYSNSFFMKKRKKEVALYSLLGVRKQQIGFMLFFENLFIGIVSLIAGIGIGFLMSKVLLTILIRLMGYSLTAGFTFSMPAVINTIIVFSILFLFTSLQGYRVIYQFKLIDLFHAEKQGEAMPKASIISAIIGTASIATGYYFALADIMTSTAWRIIGIAMPIVIIGLTIFGTYLLFHSVSVFLLQAMKKIHRYAWKNLNLITTSQLLYRIRGNAKSLTVIAVLSATTITAGGAVFGLYYNISKTTTTSTPITFMWKGEALDVPEVDYHNTLTLKDVTLTNADAEYNYMFMSLSDYNKLAVQQGKQEMASIKEGQSVLLDPFFDERFSNKVKGETYTTADTQLQVAEQYEYGVTNIGTTGNIMIVADSTFETLQGEAILTQMYQVKEEADQLQISRDLEKRITEQQQAFTSHPADFEQSMSGAGAMLFVGSFLGLVFLTATGSIIYFKVISEAEADKDKYTILYKIGVNDQQMLKTIATQVAIIFGAPLIVGITHASVALLGFSNLLGMSITKPVLLWMAAYTLIYVLYYIFTTRAFYKIVKNARRNI
ncbi:ABC transporter permease [Lysinibacillus alkalisoli]|uniref:ABC transporter permease n=1 Tax=Lysinibacillus alkalisoli TaxID=1911548 RepID=A0A917D450_9BACI|nr:ABC transporter permease [Lysinibacillus alkalisoli]GGG10628.1 ABC transporter permease [Lysinibacillus alkalisoli]